MTEQPEIKPEGDELSSEKNRLGHLKLISPIKCLLALAILYTLYFAQTLILLILFTALIALLLSPWVSLLKRLYIPRALSAVILLTLLVMPFSFLVVELAEPIQKWAKLVPKLSVHLTEQIDLLSEEFKTHENNENVKSASQQDDKGFDLFAWFRSDEPEQKTPEATNNVVAEQLKQSGVGVAINMLSATPMILAQILSCFILILFLLIFSPPLFDAFIQSLPNIENKNKAVRMVHAIQKELSRYIVIVSTINIALGLSTAAALHFIGMEDALLWGVLVGLLNFMPYLGAAIGSVIFRGDYLRSSNENKSISDYFMATYLRMALGHYRCSVICTTFSVY